MPSEQREPLAGVDAESVSAANPPDGLRAALAHEDPTVRTRGLVACEAIAAEDVDAAASFVDDVGPLLRDESSAVARRAGGVLAAVAEERPASLLEAVPSLVNCLSRDNTELRLLGITLLSHVVLERPEAVTGHVPALVDSLSDLHGEVTPEPEELPGDAVSRQTVRNHTAEERAKAVEAKSLLGDVVVAVLEAEPAAGVGVVEDLASLLTVDDVPVAAAAASSLRAVAEGRPDAVTSASAAILDALDHDAAVVRARSIRALGHVEDPASAGPLGELAREDPVPEVRALASKTARFLEDG